jgi:hypothetical protein
MLLTAPARFAYATARIAAATVNERRAAEKRSGAAKTARTAGGRKK